MMRLNTGPRPCEKEPLESVVAEALNHGYDCNLLRNRCQLCGQLTLMTPGLLCLCVGVPWGQGPGQPLPGITDPWEPRERQGA